MTESNKIAKSALIIMLFTLGSKFLGLFREVLIASKFGSGKETDTFFIALIATGLVTGFLVNAISTTFIPVISEVESKENKVGKLEHTNNMINVIIFISILGAILVLISSPLIVKILASGFKGEQFNLAVKLTRIGTPMIIFSGVIGVLTGYLQSEQEFNATALMGYPLNASYIFFLLFFSSRFGINGLMVSVLIGTFLQLLIQLPEAKRSGFKYKFIFDLKDKYIKKVIYLSLPVLVGVAINDLNVIVDKTLASSLKPGSISALNYANNLNALILGVFVIAITTVIFPVLSKEANSDNMIGLKKTMGYGVNIILLITIPATIGMMILAKPIVEIAFQRGEFGVRGTMMTSSALIFYSIGLTFLSIRLLITRVYYSLQDTKTPMVNGGIAVALNIVLNLILVKYMEHAGLALATSIATAIATLFMFYGLKKKIGSLGSISYIKCGLKAGLASLIMGLVVYLVYNGLYEILGTKKIYNLISLLASVGLGVAIYLIICYLLGIKEVREIVDKLKIRF